MLTEDGIRIAAFYAKVYNRMLLPFTAANQPRAPPELRNRVVTVTCHLDRYATRIRLPHAPREN
jgi:hypothetical protein